MLALTGAEAAAEAMRQIEPAPLNVRTMIVDRHFNLTVVAQIGDAQLCSQRKKHGRCCESFLIIDGAARRPMAVKARPIPGGGTHNGACR